MDELTGQRWVPVLVHGEEVIADSHRILEYLDHSSPAAVPAPNPPKAGGSKAGLARVTAAGRRAWPYMLMAYERWQALPAEKERYRRQAREAAARAAPRSERGAGTEAAPQASRFSSGIGPLLAGISSLGLLVVGHVHAEPLGQLAVLVHLHHDVAAADQLAADEQLGEVGHPETANSSC